ncbi:hypothetical protein C8Q73DRAFT_671639 [Cubamyces lactineus]|nr:hypothetical protein C8Q73DRAFT_671639 [Cubamyces lactineus]
MLVGCADLRSWPSGVWGKARKGALLDQSRHREILYEVKIIDGQHSQTFAQISALLSARVHRVH